MKMKTILMASTFLVLTGCADTDADSSNTNAARSKADNSQENQNVMATNALTADQQPSNEKDTKMTSQIRSALLNDKNLSTYAHNVKIITVDGIVTLKGPVRTAAERTKVLNSARLIAGNSNVTNQMDITPEVR